MLDHLLAAKKLKKYIYTYIYIFTGSTYLGCTATPLLNKQYKFSKIFLKPEGREVKFAIWERVKRSPVFIQVGQPGSRRNHTLIPTGNPTPTTVRSLHQLGIPSAKESNSHNKAQTQLESPKKINSSPTCHTSAMQKLGAFVGAYIFVSNQGTPRGKEDYLFKIIN